MRQIALSASSSEGVAPATCLLESSTRLLSRRPVSQDNPAVHLQAAARKDRVDVPSFPGTNGRHAMGIGALATTSSLILLILGAKAFRRRQFLPSVLRAHSHQWSAVGQTRIGWGKRTQMCAFTDDLD
ncbi:hypothetical protein KL929_002383 [Ogataea haglerorum]|nr:hypothetical protein KL951_003133 [Ogataea haglerorum]KAG7716308.1 hypothetical protein KL913_003519 [Ogataea haglerorum]KAG7716991.1 hypothetical protein KL949_003587 [Ogataea haglerorum]KAG7797540.1 hypothetical protein KL929_002383 [Ogataea haglerorum]